MKKHLLILVYVFFAIPSTQATDNRPWPEMTYSDKEGVKYKLVSLREISQEPFVQFITTLFSTSGVYDLYENGKPWDKERAQRLWTRIYPRTEEWFNGKDTYVPWSVIQVVMTKESIGILGTHLHTNDKAAEYKGVELCYALFPNYRNKGILSHGFKVFSQAFASQLNNLGDQFDRLLAPISPINFPSLQLVFNLGFEIGKEDSLDKPYVSGYFPNVIPEENKPRLLGYALDIARKAKENREDGALTAHTLNISTQDWEKLIALRVVAIMPKKVFFEKFLEKE